VVVLALDLIWAEPLVASRIQAEVFVPAELEALAGRSELDGPGRMVGAVRRALVEADRPQIRNSGWTS
jgi:hypothetical protein